MTTFTLTGITKRANFIYYHVAYTFSDGRIRYTEMRREKIYNDKIDLKCVHTKIVKSSFRFLLKPYQNRKKGQQSFDFMPDATVDMLLNVENHGNTF